MNRKFRSMLVAAAAAAALSFPATAPAQTTPDNGSGPAVVSPVQLPGTSSSPQAQVPQPQDNSGVNWKGVGVGAGTVVGNALYIPAKLVYGILGGVAGGAGWALTGGNTQIANTIWRSSLGGDYVLTPGMVAGHDPVHFSGPTNTAQPPQQQPLPPATGAQAAPAPVAPPAAAPAPIASAGTAHSMDSGAGPVNSTANSYHPAPATGPRGPSVSGPLPSTSIE